MHEISIAQSLIDVVVEQLIESGASRVKTVTVEVGDLSGVVPAALQSAFASAIRSEEGLAGAKLVIRPVAVTIHCPHCQADQLAVSVQSLVCRVCGTPSNVVTAGRELDVISIEVDDAAADS
ncbi:MAG: hydrogenase maturation nickel metallochaperone HypA [Tepidisphaeraceae bacterium]